MSNSLLKSTPKTHPASLVLNFDSDFSDSSVYGQEATTIGNVGISSAQTKFGANSCAFTANDSRLDFTVGDEFAFGTEDFTAECWFYCIHWSSEQVLFGMGDPTDGYGIMLSLMPGVNSSSGAKLRYSIGDGTFASGTTWAFTLNPSDDVKLNVWHHVAATRDNGIAKLYLDGALIAYGANTTDITNHNYKFTVGGRSNFSQYFTGYIDGLRVVSGASLYKGSAYILPNIPPSKNAVVTPKLDNHLVMTSTKSSGDITGHVTTTTDYYTVSWWDGTKTTYSSGVNFGRSAAGGSQNITIYPSLSDGTLSGYFVDVNVSNNNLTLVRPLYSRFTGDPSTGGFWSYVYYWANPPYTGWFRNTWVPFVAGVMHQLDVSFNNLDSSALDQIYTDLSFGDGTVNVADNTGCDSDDPTIATNKGYTVYGSLAPIVSALFNFDGANNSTTFTDSSSYNHVPTRYGNTVISTAQSKFGGASAYFDGTGDYLDVATNSVFAMGVEDFTVECWVRPTSWPTSDLGAIIESRPGGGAAGFLLWLGSDQKWVFYTSANNNGTQRVISSIDNATLNVWTHLAAVRSNGKMYFFVNGSLVGTTGILGTPDDLSPSNTAGIKIGTAADSPGNSRMFYGYMDGVKIVKGKALYTDDFVVPSSAPTTSTSSVTTGVTRLLLNCNGSNNSTTFTDSSSDARTVTRTNTVISTTQSKFGGSSAYFSNSGTDALAVTNTFNLSECDWTVEFFFYLINLTGMTNNPRLFSIEKSGESWGILLFDSAPARFASWNRFGTGSAVEMYDYTNPANRQEISLTTWHHFAMTKDNNTYRMFFNGYQIGIKAAESYTPSGNVVITIGGCRLNYQYNKLNAYMDDFRVITGKALYTSNFTPPTSQLTVYP